MLVELVVENYAVVERLRVHFHAGLNLLTGETGSGKSIVVDALGLLLGGRASADMIRTGETRARVAGIFEVKEPVAGIDIEDGELLIEREKLRLLDLWSFQRKEIESAQIEDGEDASLENERRVLQNVQKLQEAAATAFDAVYESPESAAALVKAAAKRVDELCRIDSSMEGLREHLKAADLSLQEVAYGLRDYLSGLEANPARLEEIETRLE